MFITSPDNRKIILFSSALLKLRLLPLATCPLLASLKCPCSVGWKCFKWLVRFAVMNFPLILFNKNVYVQPLFSFIVIALFRPEGWDYSLWADEEEVQSVQRDKKTSQPPNVRMLFKKYHFQLNFKNKINSMLKIQISRLLKVYNSNNKKITYNCI